MNKRKSIFEKRKKNFNFCLILTTIVILNFGLLLARSDRGLEMLAFNPGSGSKVTGQSTAEWKSLATLGFELKEGYPRPRVFTPNGDGRNEVVTFSYENANESSIVCWIYDMKGAVVRQLDIIEDGENRFTWDGKDEDGDIVPSGIYIYQIEVEGQTINGTIVLAK